MVLGFITLIVFVVLVVLLLFRIINFPPQTVLVGIAVLNLIIGMIARLFTGEGWTGARLFPNETIGGIILHPITALAVGLFIAGLLSASGGFEALKVLINKLQKTPIGLIGTLVILIQIPLLASLPCGRIIAAALLPLLFAFGPEGLKILNKKQLIILIGAFARNAFGSCGPSPIGGVGQIGEGFLGSFFPRASEGILRSPQAFSLMIGTAFMALFLKLITDKIYPADVSIKEAKIIENEEQKEKKSEKINASWIGYVSLIIFVMALLTSVFQPFGKFPVQTIFVVASFLIIILLWIKHIKLGLFGSLMKTIDDMMSGIILMPVTAMAAGFMAAGSLYATGGFDALGMIFDWIRAFPLLGIAGMLAIFVQVQTILPLSCSRILTAALVPVLYLFGPAKYGYLDWTQLAIVMSAYMINATTSCGPSPLGGAGMMAEGTIRAETGYMKGAFSFISMAILAPLAAIFMKYINADIFQTSGMNIKPNILALLGLTIIIVIVNWIILRLLANLLVQKSTDLNRGWNIQFIGFLIAGAFSGAVLAFSLFEINILYIIQGAIGGVISAAIIAAMTPKAQNIMVQQTT